MAAATMIIGCSKNDVINEPTETPIDFTKAFIEKNTKSVYTSATQLQTPGFGVFGLKNDGSDSQVFGQLTSEAYAGTKVSTANWTYDHKRYWDKEATHYKFYAYAPYNTITNTTTNTGDLGQVTWDVATPATSFKIEGFKQKTTQSDMIDILTHLDVTVANSAYNKSTPDKVQFTFSHILSNINIQVAISEALYTDRTNNPVTITSVSLGAIKMDGDYQYSNSAYAWTLASSPTTQTFSATATNGVVIASSSLSNTTYANVPGLTELLFIPQALPNGQNDKYVINIDYKIGDEEFSRTIPLNSFFKKQGETTTYSTSWISGYQYNYHLIIGPDPIEFNTPSIGGWEQTDTYEYTIQ